MKVGRSVLIIYKSRSSSESEFQSKGVTERERGRKTDTARETEEKRERERERKKGKLFTKNTLETMQQRVQHFTSCSHQKGSIKKNFEGKDFYQC